jgi:hypothetical protein
VTAQRILSDHSKSFSVSAYPLPALEHLTVYDGKLLDCCAATGLDPSNC